MILGYNTNGLSRFSPPAAIELLAKIGYRSIAISIDDCFLNPFGADLSAEIRLVAAALAKHGFRSVIETGARFLLDPNVKHEPTLVTVDAAARARRVDFLIRAIDIAADLKSDCVSLWSGVVRDGAGEPDVMRRLVDGLVPVLEHAAKRGVVIGFEPEPGMYIDTMSRYRDLLNQLSARQVDLQPFQLTIDIGHLHCMGEVPISEQLRAWADRLVNVHIEDMRRGMHEHLMFGEGEIDFPPVIAALREIGYHGVLGVELSRHAAEGPAAAQKAYDFLHPML
jgi:L-ribulose-5-phosphate 3-epimerase